MLYIIGAAILFFFLYYIFNKKMIYIETVSAAIVMAIGVYSINVAPGFAIQNIWLKWMALIALTIWAFFMVSYLFSFITSTFKALHYENIIGRFRIGTWVASTSVTVIIISNYFPVFDRIVIPLVFLNTLLWLFFFTITIRSIVSIFKDKRGKGVNGILFLTTVSTQSLVLMYNNVWDNFYQFYYINEMLIALGLLFYLGCVALIVKRYTKYSWNLIDDWKAPNCMFHGALSILGSAAVISESIHFNMVWLLWVVVIIIFVANEIVEVVRGILRVHAYGFINGLCVYDSSQWSRVFTFCMFYTFTLKFSLNYDIQTAWIVNSQQAILIAGKWIITMLILIEIGLLIQSRFVERYLDTALREAN